MKTLRALLNSKLDDENFKCLYDAECTVCKFTVRIIEKIHLENIPLETVATELGVNVRDIRDLEDAEHCNPQLVVRLCHHFSLESPVTCPKMDR